LLESIIGQEIVKRMLYNEINKNLLPQTLLFFGPEGSGKFLTALEIARIVNCLKDGSDSCNCESCRTIKKLTSPNLLIISRANLNNSFDIWFKYGVDSVSFPYFYRDTMRLIFQRRDQINNKLRQQRKPVEKIEEVINREIGFLRDSVSSYDSFINANKDDVFDAISNFLGRSKENYILIDEIREIKRFLQHSSGLYKKKVVIIDGAEYMNEEASNSLLKISEDTPKDSLIILTAVDKKKLRDTVVSRARDYRFISLSSNEKKEILYRLYKRDIFFNGKDKNEEDILHILKKIYNSKNNYEAIFNIVSDIVKNGKDIDIIDYLESVYIKKIQGDEELSIENVYKLENILKELDEEKRKLRSTNVNRELSLSNFIINNLLV